jgi:hypothetical protein
MLGIIGKSAGAANPLNKVKWIAIGLIIVAVGSAIYWLQYTNKNLTEQLTKISQENGEYKEANGSLALRLSTMEMSLLMYQQETQRQHDIIAELKLKEVAREKRLRWMENYVKDYSKNTAIPKCDLSVGWVYGHDEATKGSTQSGLSSSNDSSRTGSVPSAPENLSGIKDDQALSVISYNYGLYLKLVDDYEALRKSCSRPAIKK